MIARPAAYIISGVTGALIVMTLYGLIGSRGDSGARTGTDGAPAAAPADLATLDRRADSLSLTIAAFTLRAKMFDTRRMACPGLSRGLQQVEDAWLSYSIARKETMSMTDPAHDERDRNLYADVRTVELRFERSSCGRP